MSEIFLYAGRQRLTESCERVHLKSYQLEGPPSSGFQGVPKSAFRTWSRTRKIKGFGLKRIHMVRKGLMSRQAKAICIRIIFKGLHTPRRLLERRKMSRTLKKMKNMWTPSKSFTVVASYHIKRQTPTRRLGYGMAMHRCTDSYVPWLKVELPDKGLRCAFRFGVEKISEVS